MSIPVHHYSDYVYSVQQPPRIGLRLMPRTANDRCMILVKVPAPPCSDRSGGKAEYLRMRAVLTSARQRRRPYRSS